MRNIAKAQSKNQIRPASKDMIRRDAVVLLPREFAELDAYRLEKDWSWNDLSRAFIRARIDFPLRTLAHLVRTAGYTKPRDRTVYKIRKFLIWAEENDAAAFKRARAYVERTAVSA